MDLTVEPWLYEPSINYDGNYVDYLPPSNKFKNGLRCHCGARKDHVFYSKNAFSSHIKTKSHQTWLVNFNGNKMNYYTEYEELKDIVKSQKIIIAKMENELNTKIKTINYLSQKLMEKDTYKTNVNEMLTCD